MNQRLYKMILISLFTAIVTIATMIIQIPMPLQGYVNLGDCIILLAAWLLGPAAGLFAGGAGSMLADLLTGYFHYAPGSLLVKGLMGIVAALLFSCLHKPEKGSGTSGKVSFSRLLPLSSLLVSAIAAEAVMVLGYFLYDFLLLGNGFAAAAGIPGNLLQALAGMLSATLFYPLLIRTGIKRLR